MYLGLDVQDKLEGLSFQNGNSESNYYYHCYQNIITQKIKIFNPIMESLQISTNLVKVGEKVIQIAKNREKSGGPYENQRSLISLIDCLLARVQLSGQVKNEANISRDWCKWSLVMVKW